jgi:uncharacterized protein
MIIDFSVKNFRSFREEQKLSFVANNRDETLPEALIDPKLAGTEFAKIRLLKGLVVYGSNAAGKTNTLKALSYVAHMVESSATDLDEGDATGVEPFLFDVKTPDEPSEFILRFVVAGIRYHFVLVLNKERILYESLSTFPKGREQVWYERSWDDEALVYTWEPARPTDYKRDANLVKYTRDNALYLSTAVKFNDEQLKPIYLWFKDNICMLRLNADFPPLSPSFTAKQIMSDVNKRAQLTRLLQHADLGILSAKASERQLTHNDLPDDMPDEIVKQIIDKKHVKISLGHRGCDGREYSLEWEDESSGTQKFFALAGPWLDILENGYIAGLDEIESSMHPLMVQALLKLVFSNTTNAKGAQLIFTTHNPLLLDTGLIRRDQVWFADKSDEGGTYLYPLTDYKPRKKESLVRGYMAGRYGAVPFIPSGLLGDESKLEAVNQGATQHGEG